MQESESSASSNTSEANDQLAIGDDVIKLEQDDNKLQKTEYHDQGSCEESVFIPEFTSPSSDPKCLVKEFSRTKSDSILERSSIITNSDSSEKVNSHVKSVICNSKTVCEHLPGKVDCSPDSRESCDGVENGFIRQQKPDKVETGGLTIDNTCSSNNPMELCMKYPALINSDNNVKLPSCRGSVPNSSIFRHRNDVKLGIRDDDENFSRFNKQSTKPKAFRSPPRIGDRRIRKLLTSKYWKVAPKLKNCELSKVGKQLFDIPFIACLRSFLEYFSFCASVYEGKCDYSDTEVCDLAFLDGGMKPPYRKRKICYSRERYQHDSLYKRRKLSGHSLVMTSDGGFSSESVCNSPEKGMIGDKNGSAAMLHGGPFLPYYITLLYVLAVPDICCFLAWLNCSHNYMQQMEYLLQL